MTRLNFRVWDKDLKTIVSTEDNLTLQITNNELTVAYSDSLHQITNYELLKSTGLFDKNGKLIFEGDIVIQTSYLNENYKPNNIVVERDEWNCEFNISRTFNYEIIGNKYQHPHLLEKE